MGGLCLVLVLLCSTLCPSSVAITFMGKESWLLYFNCVPDVLWLLVFCRFSSWYQHGVEINLFPYFFFNFCSNIHEIAIFPNKII